MSAYTRRMKKKMEQKAVKAAAKAAAGGKISKEQKQLLKKREQARLKKQQKIDALIHQIGETVECDWYPDDCMYCRNCHFSWMDLVD